MRPRREEGALELRERAARGHAHGPAHGHAHGHEWNGHARACRDEEAARLDAAVATVRGLIRERARGRQRVTFLNPLYYKHQALLPTTLSYGHEL